MLFFCESLLWCELLGVEEAPNRLDKPSEERNLIKVSRGMANLLCTLERTLEGKLWPEGPCNSEENTSLRWVCRYCGGQAI